MGRAIAALAKVAWCIYQATAEVIHPHTVDDDTGGEWILWIGDPARQRQPPSACGDRVGPLEASFARPQPLLAAGSGEMRAAVIDHRGHTWLDLFSLPLVVAC